MSSVKYLLIFVIIAVIKNVISLQMIPERAGVVYVNDKYVSNVTINVRRYSRRSLYYLNANGIIKQTWVNNVSLHYIFYEYLHNEYKRSFVEMHFKFCDMVEKDPYVGKALANAGITCPLPAGPVHANNITVPAENFPNVWPFEKMRIETIIKLVSPEEPILTLEIFVSVRQRIG